MRVTRKRMQRRASDCPGSPQGRPQEGPLALQSVPLGPQRANVGIYYKELPEDVASITPESFAADWEQPYQVSDTTSAYSTMLQLKNGNIAFYYEESITLNGWGYDMVYKFIDQHLKV